MINELDQIVEWMYGAARSTHREGMERFGINSRRALGIPLPDLRIKARQYRNRHDLALGLWETDIHEARILASLTDDPACVTPEQMDAWTSGFDSWDICDQCCVNLFRKVPFAYGKIKEYAADEREFVRRTSFVLIATLAVHDKHADDDIFGSCLGLIEESATDERNFVKKAVNWALRQIGKRNMELNEQAVRIAERLAKSENKCARWVGKDALRELTSQKTLRFIAEHRAK